MDELVGKKFKHLTVLSILGKKGSRKNSATFCLCRCDCGSEIEVNVKQLGRKVTCGCRMLKQIHPGDIFGKLTIIKECGRRHGGKLYQCRCSCGKLIKVRRDALLTGHTKSCGKCPKPKHISAYKMSDGYHVDLTGEVFGKLTVLGFCKEKKKWKCKCSCGNITYVNTRDLNSGDTKSCGCNKGNSLRLRKINMKGKHVGTLTVLYENGRTADGRVIWHCKCDCGNEVDRIYDYLVNVDRPTCSKCSSCIGAIGSSEELKIRDFITQFVNEEDIVKDRTVLEGKEIDIYIPILNLGIEYNGSVFHATVNSVYTDKPYTYHRDKFLKAKEKGVHLITVFDVDWSNNQDKIKAYLKSLLTPSKALYGRNCTITKIDKDVADEFTDKYHIQGATKFNSINYGLFYQSELVSVMSFGKLRMEKDKQDYYELHRYCVKSGITIFGGANKLLKHFEKEYNPKYIRSYSDNDYFLGGIYTKLGFINKGQCKPRYYWFLQDTEIKREQCKLARLKRKYPKLYDEAVTSGAKNKEDYIMVQLGAKKVYRSGNTKWEKFR